MTVLICWTSALVTSALLIAIALRARELFVKPSVVVVAVFHIVLQWPATLQAASIVEYLPHPTTFFALAHIFPLAALVLTLATARRGADAVFERLRTERPNHLSEPMPLVILGLLAMALAAVYLSAVPLQQTGLYSIVRDPFMANRARDESFKGLDSAAVRYAFALLATAVAPLLSVLLWQTAGNLWRARRYAGIVLIACALVALLLVVSLPGSRVFPFLLVLTIAMAWAYQRGLPLNPLVLGAACTLALAGPTLLTLMREGQRVTVGSFTSYLKIVLVERVLDGPIKPALWYAHYAQTAGFFGVAGIPRLAELAGVPAANVPNLIGLWYYDRATPTVHADTAYVFSYYSYFGFRSLLVSIVLLLLLDVSIVLYRGLSHRMLTATVATVSVAALSFVSTDYTTVFLSHGFGTALLVALAVDYTARLFAREPARG